MRLKEDRGTLRGGPILLLGLWALLGPVQCSPGRPLWRYISSEVVIPRKQMHRGRGMEVPGWVSYSLKFGGQRHVIHMRLKNLFKPRHLPVMSQDDQGALQMDYPYVPRDCYYLGYLEDIPYSLVTADTCYGGIKGIMKLDDLAYEIKPLKDSLRFEHVVSQIVAERNETEPAIRQRYTEATDSFFSAANTSAAPRLSATYKASHAGGIQGLGQCSFAMYSVLNNMSKAVRFLIDIGSVMDAIFWRVHLRYYVVGLMVYNQGDPGAISSYNVPGSPFYMFYLTNLYSAIPHSSSYLVDKNGPFDSEFNSAHSCICKAEGLIYVGFLYRHYLLLGVIATQQVARNIGLHYDSNECYCYRRTYCVMQRYPGITDAFSNCSMAHMNNILRASLPCLFEYPSYANRSMTVTRCGNGVVEEREQCDCGSYKQCYSNPCCESNCRLTPESTCDMGGCCTNCTYSPIGTLCRPIMNICDLPEYCTGNTFKCPDNFYLQDGTPCTEEGYCYRGNCTDRNMHCKEIFGMDAVNANDACYTINTKAVRFGHCRRLYSYITFIKCAPQDVKCGRLQCTNITQLPRLQDHVSFHQSIISGALCFGLDSHRSTETTDVGHVRNGTPCADGLFCLNTYCNAPLSAIKYDCLPEKCSYRGICNNKKNCHCHVGWDPPLCLKLGSGGSVDSGPPPRTTRTITPTKETVVYLRVVYGRIYGLIFAFLIGLATNVRAITITKVTEDEEQPKEDMKGKSPATPAKDKSKKT
ncbi:disintegrin and metalloproteinase domain-containing protein 21-like [Choloepus didactylus]|uniref:disintegrin and metalloproteinase domain-containing protein 21-like n=1 Tax=Choloepus didactylus TaxID=27675 RepID=UPI00189DCEC1|nr:disintegrin and metalloproteinase domain-containing protein 21-like [Choloepus didactylus]